MLDDGRVTEASDAGDASSVARRNAFSRALARSHRRLPYVRMLPLPVVGIILTIAAVNAIVWAVVGVILHFHGALLSTAVLSYTLGLRHALDADHISAIDLMTRRLVAAGQRPVTVGTFFSLGHSTIVIITSIVVAATAAGVSKKFDQYSKVGGLIGSSVSASFLILLGLANAYILYKLLQQMQRIIDHRAEDGKELEFEGAGCLFSLFKKMFKLIDRPWKMYPLGVLFGLGFDTSSEIALLGIASIEAAKGTNIWLILIFPLLFTGMCLLDTVDGALMMTLYTSTALAKKNDPLAILYYSSVLTGVTVLAALAIGFIQLLSLVRNVARPKGRFWDGLQSTSDHFDILGGAICASFVVFGGLSILLYRPWRRSIEKRRSRKRAVSSVQAHRPVSGVASEPWLWLIAASTQRSKPSLHVTRPQPLMDTWEDRPITFVES